mgnify:FL=1
MSTDFAAVERALRTAALRFPGCRIANCKCDSKRGEWKRPCWCMCHFKAMDEKFGKKGWNLDDFEREVKVGR